MHTFFICLQIFSLMIAFVALFLMLRAEVTEMQQMMVCFLFCILVHSAGYLMELMSTTPEAAYNAIRMQYFGSCWTVFFFCRFAFIYCGFRMPKWLAWLSGIMNCVVQGMTWLLDQSNLLYEKCEWIPGANGYGYFDVTYGIAFYLFVIFCLLIPHIMVLGTLIYTMRTSPRDAKTKNLRLFLGMAFLPPLVLFLYATKIINTYDPCPATLAISMSFIVIFVWRKQNYDMSRVAEQTVLNEMDDCVIVLDNEGRVQNYNRAATSVFVTLGKNNIGRDVLEVDGFPKEMFDSNGKLDFDLHGGHYEGHMKAVIDKNQKLRGYVLLIFDMTATQSYIEEIIEMRERAEVANKAKSEFLANMSHEIRTPMNAIVGLSELIMEESRGRKVYNYACDIKSSSRNLLAIINDILDISKVEVGRMELVEDDYVLREFMQEIVAMMRVAAKQHALELQYELDDSLPYRLRGDEGRIRQIIVNLLNNAVKFTRTGYVRLEVGGTLGENDEVELEIKVIDTGIGIRKEDQKKIFENFQQVDTKKNRSVEGTGLGLAISQRLIELMHGEITLDSVYGEGTTFTVRIPQKVVEYKTAEGENGEVVEKVSHDNRPFTAPGYRILVVDDNMINRKVAAGLLKIYGCELESVDSGKAAVDLVLEKHFDLIFMDHMMPEMDGVEATHLIREKLGEGPDAPIIIALTANAMDGVKDMFLANGFQDFLAKPVDRVPMHRMLDHWIPTERKIYAEAEEKKERNISLDDLNDIVTSSIDIKRVLEYHTGTLDDYVELLNLYLLEGKKKADYIEELEKKEDIANYRIETHGLKSASLNIGAVKVSEMAKENEDAAIRGDLEFIHANCSALVFEYKKLMDEIQTILDRAASRQDDTPKISISEAELKESLKEALMLVQTFKSKQCAEKVMWILERDIDEALRKEVEEVQNALKMYDDDAAEEKMGDIVSKWAQ